MCNIIKTTVVTLFGLAATTVAQAQTEIKMINCGSDTEAFAQVQFDHVQEWEAANPGYQVDVEWVGWGECQEKALTLAAAGNPAAIAAVGSRALKQLAGNDLIVPITLTSAEINSYEKSVISTVQFDGKIWAVPRAFSTKALFWNKDLFKAAGLPTDSAPETWKELLIAAKAISEKTDAAGIGIPAADFDNTMHGWLNWMYSNGGQVVDDSGKVVFNSRQVIETLQLYRDLVPYMQEGPLAYDRAELQPLFGQGQIAMYVNGAWGRNPESVGNTDWEIAKIPHGPSGSHSTLLITDSLVVFKSEVQDIAIELLRFLTTEERQAEIDEAGSWTPLRINDFSDALIVKDPTWKLFVEAIPTGGPEPLFTDYNGLQDVINTAIQDVISGDETPADAAETAAKELEKLL